MFMRDGGVLGFNSDYSYVFDTQWADLLTPINAIEDKAATIKQLNRGVPCDKFAHLSKDEQVKVLRDVGIEDVNCQQILDALPSDFPLLKGADYIVAESAKSLGLPVCVKPFLSEDVVDYKEFDYALKDFSKFFAKNEYLETHYPIIAMFGDATCVCKPGDITWCQKLSYHQPAGAALAYGNEADLGLWYKSAAILIRIPKWSEFRQRLIAVSTGECCDVTGAEDGMIRDFKDIIYSIIENVEIFQGHHR